MSLLCDIIGGYSRSWLLLGFSVLSFTSGQRSMLKLSRHISSELVMSWDATVSGILLIPLFYAIPKCRDQPFLVQWISSCSLTLSLFCRRHLPHEASCWFAFGWRNNNARSASRHQREKVRKVKKSETSTQTLTANSIKQCLYNISFFNNPKMLFVRCHFVQHV